jgi:hypothetical protein
MGPGEAVTRFAANMASRSESTIAPAAELAVGGVKAGPVTGFGGGAKQQWWFLALLAVMAVLALEWLSYHRRVTV